jgi:hypothetical protein
MRHFIAFFLLAMVSTHLTTRGNVINFSDVSLSLDSYENGGPATSDAGFYSGGAFLNNSFTYDPIGQYGYWNGWSLSNVNNTGSDYPGVPDYGGNHSYAAYPGGAVGGPNQVYAVGYWDGFDPTYINLPACQHPVSVDLTNTTDDVLSMQNGDDFGAKKFGPTDYFYLTLTGYSGPDETGTITGSKDFYLAQNGSIVTAWTPVDLSPLGNAGSIDFSFTSSDVGEFGINTPTYVALDDLTTVPEPTGLALVALAGALCLRGRGKCREGVSHAASTTGTASAI